jgi:hypothetical protein
LDSECGRYWFFKWFLPLKIQMNSKKPGFGRKSQLRTWQHLKAYHSIQAWFPFIFGCSKNWHIHCKTMFTCWVSLFCKGFTLGRMAQATLVTNEVCMWLVKRPITLPIENDNIFFQNMMPCLILCHMHLL